MWLANKDSNCTLSELTEINSSVWKDSKVEHWDTSTFHEETFARPCQLQVTLLLHYCLLVALWPSNLHLHLSEDHSITARGPKAPLAWHTHITPLTSQVHCQAYDFRYELDQPNISKLKLLFFFFLSLASCSVLHLCDSICLTALFFFNIHNILKIQQNLLNEIVSHLKLCKVWTRVSGSSCVVPIKRPIN